MALIIEDDQAHRLAQELAEATGESLDIAVITALRERLARVRQETRPRLAEWLMAIGKDSASRLKEPYRSIDHGDLLYDELGRPK